MGHTRTFAPEAASAAPEAAIGRPAGFFIDHHLDGAWDVPSAMASRTCLSPCAGGSWRLRASPHGAPETLSACA